MAVAAVVGCGDGGDGVGGVGGPLLAVTVASLVLMATRLALLWCFTIGGVVGGIDNVAAVGGGVGV